MMFTLVVRAIFMRNTYKTPIGNRGEMLRKRKFEQICQLLIAKLWLSIRSVQLHCMTFVSSTRRTKYKRIMSQGGCKSTPD